MIYVVQVIVFSFVQSMRVRRIVVALSTCLLQKFGHANQVGLRLARFICYLS